MFDYLRTDDAMLDALCIVAMSRSIVLCIVCIDNTLAIQNSTPMISGAAIAVGYRLRREVDPSESRLNRDACNVIAAQPRATAAVGKFGAAFIQDYRRRTRGKCRGLCGQSGPGAPRCNSECKRFIGRGWSSLQSSDRRV